MSTLFSPPIDEFVTRRLAARLRFATTLLIVGTTALLAWSEGVGLASGRPRGDGRVWAELLPPLAYLWGLVRLRSAFAAIAAGGLFGTTVRRALAGLGLAMIVGAALEVVVVPNVVFWLLGPGRGGALLRFDVGAFSVAAMGAGLLLVVRLFGTAAAMAEELDGIL